MGTLFYYTFPKGPSRFTPHCCAFAGFLPAWELCLLKFDKWRVDWHLGGNLTLSFPSKPLPHRLPTIAVKLCVVGDNICHWPYLSLPSDSAIRAYFHLYYLLRRYFLGFCAIALHLAYSLSREKSWVPRYSFYSFQSVLRIGVQSMQLIPQKSKHTYVLFILFRWKQHWRILVRPFSMAALGEL